MFIVYTNISSLLSLVYENHDDHSHDDDNARRRVACGRVGDEGEVCRVDVLLRRLQQVFFHPSFTPVLVLSPLDSAFLE